MEKEKLKLIIENLLWVCNNVEIENQGKVILKGLYNIQERPSMDCLFEQAVKIYMCENINQSKKENIEAMKQVPEELASEKQIKLLRDLGMKEIPKGLTKSKAKDLIQMNLANKKEYQR